MKKKVFILVLVSCFMRLNAQNVGISNTGAAPAASAMLDIVASDRGLLVPRLALSDITVAAPVTAPVVSLIVYNTATAGVSPNNVFPGFYYWDGTKWVAFSGSGGREWALLGNAGTVAGTNFLGTIDNVDLQFRVNNIQAGRITNTNNNTFLGYEAGVNNTSSFNAFFGSLAGRANTSGGNNVGLGFGAMRNATTGGVNTFVGNNAGANWVTTLANTAVGNQALQGLAAATGSCNTAIGFAAGSGYTGTPPGGSANGLSQLSGSYNTYIGYSSSSTTSSNTFTNSTAIGAFSQAGANDVLILGSISGANNATATTRVGVGTTTPGYRLDLNTGTFAFGNGNIRTETRDNAGLQGNAGAQSGFFETANPTNYPSGATSWWHLIDTRHSNNTNNYALQLSGSFFDQKLYFRKTNNNAAQAWTEILSSANNPVSVSLNTDYTVNTAAPAFATVTGMSVTFVATKTTALVQFSSSGFAFTNSMAWVAFRIYNSTSATSVGGTNTHMQNYDNVNGTVTPWSCSFSKNLTGLIVGNTYTLEVQGQRGGILGTLNAVINASTIPDNHHMTLTVFP